MFLYFTLFEQKCSNFRQHVTLLIKPHQRTHETQEMFSILYLDTVLELLMFKQATVDDNPTGIRWITSDLIGLTDKMRNL